MVIAEVEGKPLDDCCRTDGCDKTGNSPALQAGVDPCRLRRAGKRSIRVPATCSRQELADSGSATQAR